MPAEMPTGSECTYYDNILERRKAANQRHLEAEKARTEYAKNAWLEFADC
jgi:hypothetical protein